MACGSSLASIMCGTITKIDGHDINYGETSR
jgi:hypothetical protein